MKKNKKAEASTIKKVKLYKMYYSSNCMITGNFKVYIDEYELFDTGDEYVNECGEEVIKKYMLGKLNDYTNSMWMIEKDVEHYVNALIKQQEDGIRTKERFINACKEYKKTIVTEERPIVKLYCFLYSFATGLSRFEYDAIDYPSAYAISKNTMIDKALIDEVSVTHELGRARMFSLVDDKQAFMDKVIEYIKETN